MAEFNETREDFSFSLLAKCFQNLADKFSTLRQASRATPKG